MVSRSSQGKSSPSDLAGDLFGDLSGACSLNQRNSRGPMPWAGWWLTLLLAITLGFGLGIPQAQARRAVAEAPPEGAVQAANGHAIGLSQLPREGQTMYQRILSGGPFAHDKDGSVFGNRERLLPRQPRGFYREYTVRTPGERDRGARRIVCGGKDVRQPETCFYTRDHYASFQVIDPSR